MGIKGDVDGVYVSDVQADGAAKAAGIQKGDIITKLDGQVITGPSDLTAYIAGHKPGDKISTTYLRGGKSYTTNVTLKSSAGTLAAANKSSIDKLGGNFTTLDEATARKNNVRGGVVVSKLGTGALSNTRMQEGFVIISVNDQTVLKVEDLKKIIANASGTIVLRGFYPGDEHLYGYTIDLSGENTPSNSDGPTEDGD